MIYILCFKVQYLLSSGQLCAVIAANDDERANGTMRKDGVAIFGSWWVMRPMPDKPRVRVQLEDLRIFLSPQVTVEVPAV